MTTFNLPGPPLGGTLILIGGGEFSFGETEEIDRYLIHHLPRERRTIAFIPAASGSSEYGRHLGEHFRKLDASVEVVNVPIYRERDSRRGRNLDAIRDAGAVYLGAGVTNSLVDAVRSTPAEDQLRTYLASEGTIVAIGAAAAAVGPFCRDMTKLPGMMPGLALLPGIGIEPAFEPRADQFVRSLMTMPEVDVVLGIPPGTAVAIDERNEGLVIGDGAVAVVRRPPQP